MNQAHLLQLSLTLALTLAFSAVAQDEYKSALGSKTKIDGTSNIHDWTVDGDMIGGKMKINMEELFKAQPGKVTAEAESLITIRSLKSGKDRMDEVMQEKMSADKFPYIKYKLTELKVLKGQPGTSVECESKGELYISGVTNNITMPVTFTREEGDKFKIAGVIKLKMSAFKIEAPTLSIPVLGKITTGDEVTVGIDWLVVKKDAAAK